MIKTIVRVFLLVCAIAALVVVFQEFNVFDEIRSLFYAMVDWFRRLFYSIKRVF